MLGSGLLEINFQGDVPEEEYLVPVVEAGASGYLYMKNSSEMKSIKGKIAAVEKEIGKHKKLQQKIKNLLKQEASSKSGIKNRRLRAGWDNDDLLAVLNSLFE